MKTRLLLLALLVAPLLTAQETTCPTVFPPDSCDASVVGVSPVPDPPLTTGAVACWNLDEAVGLTRVDDCGSNDLTEGTGDDVTIIAGRNNNGILAGSFPDSCLTGAIVPMANEWTVNFWTSGWSSFSEVVFANDEIGGTFNEGAFDDFWQVTVAGQAVSCWPYSSRLF